MIVERMLNYSKPWILVDTISSYQPKEGCIVTHKQISSSDFYLRGHFHEYSIYPGVLLIEGIIQSSQLLMEKKSPLVIGKIKSRFLKMVVPGDTVTYKVNKTREDEHLIYISGEGTVNGELVVLVTLQLIKEEER